MKLFGLEINFSSKKELETLKREVHLLREKLHWIPLTDSESETDPVLHLKRRQLIEKSREAFYRNPYANAAILHAAYGIMGNGLRVNCEQTQIRALLDDFIGPIAKFNLWIFYEIILPTLLDGGRILHFITNPATGKTEIRTIGYLQLDLEGKYEGIETDPEDITKEIRYHRRNGETLPAEDCLHIKFNCIGNNTLGRPYIEAVLQVLTYESLATNGLAERIRILGNIILKHSIPEGMEQSYQNRVLPKPGSIITQIKGLEDWEFMEPQFGGGENLINPFTYAIAAGTQTPYSLLTGDDSQPTYASVKNGKSRRRR